MQDRIKSVNNLQSEWTEYEVLDNKKTKVWFLIVTCIYQFKWIFSPFYNSMSNTHSWFEWVRILRGKKIFRLYVAVAVRGSKGSYFQRWTRILKVVY